MPVTLELIGVPMKFFIGIKIVIYDRVTMTESGVFIRVEQSEWILKDSEKNRKVKKATKTDSLVENYSLAAVVSSKAFDILKSVAITDNRLQLSTSFGLNVLSSFKKK